MPSIIESAYRGESLPVLNSIIAGQAKHPVDKYVADWNALANHVLLVFLVFGLGFFVISNTRFQRYWEARYPPSDGAGTGTLSRRRVRIIYLVGSVLVVGSLYDIATDTEQWPLSQYSMYRTVRWRDQVTKWHLFGVHEGGEIPLTAQPYFRPFTRSLLLTTLRQRWSKPNRTELLDEALLNFLALYQASRRDGFHDGPPLTGLRLYQLTWTLDHAVHKKAARPDEKELAHEVWLAEQ